MSEPGKNAYRLQFFDSNGKRKSMRFRAPKAQALTIQRNVDIIVLAKEHNVPVEPQTIAWLSTLNDEMAEKFTKAGLIQPRKEATLLGFFDAYIAARTDLKPNTLRNWGNTKRLLLQYFGLDTALRTITSDRCISFRQHLVKTGQSPPTISGIVKHSKQLFKVAHRQGLVDLNPFADIKAGSQRNEARQYFVTRTTIEKVLKCAPCLDWSTIIVLCRYGGLRCPCEVLTLRWKDINWEDGTISVHSPKGEGHGKGVRLMPLFKEIRETLELRRNANEVDDEFVIARYRYSDGKNLWTQFARIVKKAGIEPWDRLFHNLRASRQTELTNDFPAHVVSAWLGNTLEVAAKHYLQVTHEHFEKALALGNGRK